MQDASAGVVSRVAKPCHLHDIHAARFGCCSALQMQAATDHSFCLQAATPASTPLLRVLWLQVPPAGAWACLQGGSHHCTQLPA